MRLNRMAHALRSTEGLMQVYPEYPEYPEYAQA